MSVDYLQATNASTAKRIIDSVSRTYVHAKRAAVELENCTRGLIKGGTSVPLQGTPQEFRQVMYDLPLYSAYCVEFITTTILCGSLLHYVIF